MNTQMLFFYLVCFVKINISRIYGIRLCMRESVIMPIFQEFLHRSCERVGEAFKLAQNGKREIVKIVI